MLKVSKENRINDFINEVIKTGKWEVRKNKHTHLQHKETGICFVVPGTPRNGNGYNIFIEQYRRAVRKVLAVQGTLTNYEGPTDA